MAIKFNELTDQELLYGQKTCPGCAAPIAVRLALKVLGENTFTCLPACCMCATTSVYPQMSFFINNTTTAFPATASTCAGMAAAAKMLGIEDDVTILGIAGDGGTTDIGLQALSGACERNDNILYLCYDNEAYMNTGIQRSGSTPYGAWTTTSPTNEEVVGKNVVKKNLFDIICAHRIPYAATASVAYPRDLLEKIAKAKDIKGARFIHIQAPCPTGWGYKPELTVDLAKMAVENGLWTLAEYQNGKLTVNVKPKTFKPVKAYLSAQRRFRHLKEEDFAEIEKQRDQEWELLRRKENEL